MEDAKKILESVLRTTVASNQSPTDADAVIMPSLSANFEVDRLVDQFESSSLLNLGCETNPVDEHHESLDVKRLDDSLSSKRQSYNSNNDVLIEDCMLEIFSYLSIDDMIQVKRVCKKWYLVSQQWFKRVQTLVYNNDNYDIYDDMNQGRMRLYENHYKRRIYQGFETKKLMSILKSCGHHIKYFQTKIDAIGGHEPYEERKKFIYHWCPKLCKNIVNAKIRVSNYDFSPSSSFKFMAKHWKKLENLEISPFCPSNKETFYKLLRNNQQLKDLSLVFLYDDYIDDKIFTCLPTTMKKIRLVNMELDDKEQWSHFRSAFKNFTSLQSLDLSCFEYLPDAVVMAIANIKSLNHLRLGFQSYESRREIESIADLKGLKSLSLSNSSDLLEDSLIKILESCIQLEHLDLCGWEFLTDRGMAVIAKLERLKMLYICGRNVSTESILNLPVSLEIFVCYPLKMNDIDVIKFLKKATNLRFLELSTDNITKDVLEAANEIANERKNNILCIYLQFFPAVDHNIDTPYFKFYQEIYFVPTRIFPKDIRINLKEFYGFISEDV